MNVSVTKINNINNIMQKYGKLGTQPAFFYFSSKLKLTIGKKIKFALLPGKYSPKYEGVIDNLEPFRVSYL